jgi:uridine phosphorylase
VPIHLRPTASLAPRALLPSDPGLALALAQALLEGPRMSNHSRGLWGYTGRAADGGALTIQSTGIGGPSAAIVLDELIELGVTRAIRVGTCSALPAGRPGAAPAIEPAGGSGIGLGDLLIVEAAVAGDGTSRALGAPAAGVVSADRGLGAAISAAATASEAARGRVVSVDLLDGFGAGDLPVGAGEAGVVAVDLETAALFTLGGRRAVAVGCVLVVSATFGDAASERLGDERLALAGERAGRLAAAGLGARG